MIYNEHAWTKAANLLIINSPPPVGYSYCTPAGPSGDANSCGTWNDSKTAYHNSLYLENWMAEFPEYAKHDIYIIGESYAGIYVPTLVREILNNATSVIKPQLKGMAIGDGCVGTDVLCGDNNGSGPGPYYMLKFFGGHGQFSDKLYDEIMDKCPRDQLIGYNGLKVTDENCTKLIEKAQKEMGGYFEYSLYDDCWYNNDVEPPTFLNQSKGYWGPPKFPGMENIDTSLLKSLQGGLNDYPCGGVAASFKWLNHELVKEAINVDKDAVIFSGDNGDGFTYNMTEKNLLPFYKELVTNTSIRVLVYNGDTDPCLDSLSGQNWTTSLGFKETQEWRPWTIDGKQYMGGYVTRYENDFDFLTIRGSGHMVPEYKPKVTLEFLEKWLKGEEWLAYNATADLSAEAPGDLDLSEEFIQ